MIYKASNLNSFQLDTVLNDLSHLGEEGHEHIEIKKDPSGFYYPATASKPRRIRWFLFFFFRWKPERQRLQTVSLFLQDFLAKNAQKENEIVSTLKKTKFSQWTTKKPPNGKLGIDLNKFTITQEMMEEQVETKCADPAFKQTIEGLFAYGNLMAVKEDEEANKLPNLQFIPDCSATLSRGERLRLIGTSCLIAPKQPEERPFVYVGLGSGALRQDLHQILAFLTDEPQRRADTTDRHDPLVKNISIHLIDTAYASQEEFAKTYSGSFSDYLVEFLAILKLKAPDSRVDIHFFDSVESYRVENKETSIDFLSGIRLPDSPEVQETVSQLSEKLSVSSGALITNEHNREKVIYKKEGQRTEVKTPEGINNLYQQISSPAHRRIYNISQGVSHGGGKPLHYKRA